MVWLCSRAEAEVERCACVCVKAAAGYGGVARAGGRGRMVTILFDCISGAPLTLRQCISSVNTLLNICC